MVRFADPGAELYGTELPVGIGTIVTSLTVPDLTVDTAGLRLEG